jgi:cell division protein FtsI/penicillin-binding protein 2
MRRFAAAGIACAAFCVAAVLFAGAPSKSTDAGFREPRGVEPPVSYLLLDARSGALLDSRWPAMDQAVAVGSLIKPFTALGYAQTHGYRYPTFECRGESAGCWWPAGHGRIGIEAAVSHSCNVYFGLLAERVDHGALSAVAWRFGIPAPLADAPRAAYVGLGDAWRSAPLALARAYLELVRRQAEPGVAPLLDGMRQSAETGTGRGAGAGLRGLPAWAKTGTAPCVHRPALNGDGYAMVIFPAPRPRYVLLIQRHGVPGRLAAVAVGAMLADLERGIR